MSTRYSEESSSNELASLIQQKSNAQSKTRGFLRWIQISINIVFLVLLISILGVLIQFKLETDFGGDVNHFVPRFSEERIKFEPHLDISTLNYTSSQEAQIVRQRWQALLPKGGGNIHVPEHTRYKDLSEPFLDPNGTPLWKVSWTHQLHCLYYIMDAYDQVIRYGSKGTENQIEEGHSSVHTNHCFDYLRQAILCNSDMTLEGGTRPGDHKGTNGFGHLHSCRNNKEAVQWIEGYRISDKRFIIDINAPV
ncbi:hypothetical protein COCC4DRAFT_154988 [Bipolaris maydis ATCC 48331]|uniref:Uncharacterized protein n=2 Tax=Cochliobolus heterostrophus TaxID=5016 RepID=M2UD24_COCH5|nr:uncharacterized protein COCC4DRAFT_154988 [Bipolaris maydis ATCC 48331]EMD85873.1 hypothetical protein COCHEDRAFT_1186822 [Bipolaris maydis C5]KAJ5057388.1 hypothetical protein J3E74DRAFT_477353 [Bipolaris maydis]ENH98745.1 hypothetical protein COCC4DRAFT_154988 [Bipolaris maydis ATCC 48331]KAJ6212883.1 hypothetical protein PSV09DRAFT_1186822 [Bipolaris maydis]KAJ6265132.1 hypothetical protein PSV08DRAFT_406259 [Bipolaris maydis]